MYLAYLSAFGYAVEFGGGIRNCRQHIQIYIAWNPTPLYVQLCFKIIKLHSVFLINCNSVFYIYYIYILM